MFVAVYPSIAHRNGNAKNENRYQRLGVKVTSALGTRRRLAAASGMPHGALALTTATADEIRALQNRRPAIFLLRADKPK
jgi:hypothetical protein